MLQIKQETDRIIITLDGDAINVAWNDRKCLVTGLGHSGTNLLLEMVKASGCFNYYSEQEDRMFCSGVTALLTANYLAKLACDSINFKIDGFYLNMSKFLGLKVLVSCRHPLDRTLSTVYRGLPLRYGGDADSDDNLDFTYDEKHAAEIIDYWARGYIPMLVKILNTFGPMGRAVMYKMEDVITIPEAIAKEISTFFDIEYRERMAQPWKYNTHVRQIERYNGVLDLGQIDVYKRWQTEYDGFFADKKDFVFALAEGLKPYAEMFDYKIEDL